MDKRIAKRVALSLNGQPILAQHKRSRFSDDLFMIKYLKGFKWHHLTDQIAYQRQVRETKIREEMSAAKRDSEHYLQQVAKAQQINRKRARDTNADDDTKPKKFRLFHQRQLLDDKDKRRTSSQEQ